MMMMMWVGKKKYRIGIAKFFLGISVYCEIRYGGKKRERKTKRIGGGGRCQGTGVARLVDEEG